MRKTKWSLWGWLLLLALLLTACKNEPTPLAPTATLEPTPTRQETATLPPQPTATLSPLGSPDNPLVIGFVGDPQDQKVSTAATSLADQMCLKTGYTIQSKFSPSYSSLVDSMAKGNVQIAWLPPLTYLYAQQLDLAQVVLLTNHFGVYHFGSQFMVKAGTGYQVFFDPEAKNSTADAAHALVQFAGKRPCLVSPDSVSGYVVPLGVLASESIQTQDPVITREQNSVIRALYAGGICDFGATFSVSGDPRTAQDLQTELPDVLDKVLITWQTDPVIPNLNLSFTPTLTTGMRVKLRDAFLEFALNQEGLTLLSDSTQYEIADLRAVDDKEYIALKTYVEALKLSLGDMLGN